MTAQERVARILCRLMGDEWQQGERLYRNTADEIIATLAPASNVAPREAGIQAFYADESTSNTLQGLNAAFDAYEAAARVVSLRDEFAASATEQDIERRIPKTVGETADLLVSLGWITQADRQRDVLRSYGDKHRSDLRCWARYQHADAMLAMRSKAKEG